MLRVCAFYYFLPVVYFRYCECIWFMLFAWFGFYIVCILYGLTAKLLSAYLADTVLDCVWTGIYVSNDLWFYKLTNQPFNHPKWAGVWGYQYGYLFPRTSWLLFWCPWFISSEYLTSVIQHCHLLVQYVTLKWQILWDQSSHWRLYHGIKNRVFCDMPCSWKDHFRSKSKPSFNWSATHGVVWLWVLETIYLGFSSPRCFTAIGQ